MRITRSTLVFFVVCVAIIIAMLVFLNTPASAPTGSNTTPTPAVTVRLFPDLTQENLARIGVVDTIGEAETVYIKQADTSWKVDTTTTDTTGDVTQDAIEESARLLAELTAESFPAEGRNLADFGLEAPAYVISFTTDDGAANTFKIGRQNSTSRSYYALLNDDAATIYLLSSANRITTLIGYAGQPPYVPVPTATPQPSLQVPGVIFPEWTGLDVTRFELRDNVSKDVLIITRNEDDTWSIAEATNSKSLPVSQELIQVVINSFGYIPVTAAVDDVDPAAIGLDKPAYTVAGFTDGITAYQLQIGDSDVSGKLYYVKVNDIPQVALIDKGALDALLNLIVEPPYAPEATPEATSESTAEATAEATAAN